MPTLTPYDTGTRLEPRSWIPHGTVISEITPADSFGRVDFDDEEGGTTCVVYVERTDEGAYTVHVEALTDLDEISVQLHEGEG